MLDELKRLRDNAKLLIVLAHYDKLGTVDREVWQDRLMEWEGASTRDLVKWHGELLAFGWIEQNTGNVPILRAGAVPGCYRITSAGQKAFVRVRIVADGAEDLDAEAA